MVPDKATGIAKGSAFVFVAGKKVHAHPTREPVKNVKPVELLVVSDEFAECRAPDPAAARVRRVPRRAAGRERLIYMFTMVEMSGAYTRMR